MIGRYSLSERFWCRMSSALSTDSRTYGLPFSSRYAKSATRFEHLPKLCVKTHVGT